MVSETVVTGQIYKKISEGEPQAPKGMMQTTGKAQRKAQKMTSLPPTVCRSLAQESSEVVFQQPIQTIRLDLDKGIEGTGAYQFRNHKQCEQ